MIGERLGKLPSKALLHTFKVYIEYVNDSPVELITNDWRNYNKTQKKFNPFNRLPCCILGDFVVNMN